MPKSAKLSRAKGTRGQLAGKEGGTSKGVGRGKGKAGEMLKQAAEEVGGCYIGRPMVEVTQQILDPQTHGYDRLIEIGVERCAKALSRFSEGGGTGKR